MYVVCYWRPGQAALFTQRPMDKTTAQQVAKRYRKVGYEAYEVALPA
jgi:hypothetical protein